MRIKIYLLSFTTLLVTPFYVSAVDDIERGIRTGDGKGLMAKVLRISPSASIDINPDPISIDYPINSDFSIKVTDSEKGISAKKNFGIK